MSHRTCRPLSAAEHSPVARFPPSRSQGQFFQSLYQTKAKRPVGLSSEQLQVWWMRHNG